jgi:hypothetical protein
MLVKTLYAIWNITQALYKKLIPDLPPLAEESSRIAGLTEKSGRSIII